MSNGNDGNDVSPGENGGSGGEAPLNTGRPAVAAAPGKLVFVLLFAAFFVFVIVKSLFFGEKPAPPEPPHRTQTVVQATKGPGNESPVAPPTLPPPPAAEIAPPSQLPPLAPPPPPPVLPPNPELHVNAPVNEALMKRIRSPMLTTGGGLLSSSPAAKHRAAVATTNDPNSAFAQSVSETSAATAEATRIKNLNTTIAQGKLIHAILESAIDSDLPGPIRAIVSHDTYAEAGRDVLIPKGSRLIGVYNSALKRGQVRVFIIWQRVIRPDGIDIQIDSPGVDALGRAGVTGDVDNKYFEIFSAAILTSSLDIGVAAVGDALFGNQQSTTTNNGTGSSTTQSPTATAMQQSIQNIGNVGTNIVNNVLNLSPTIYVDQGTPIEVFVNRDLIFPPQVTGRNGFIQ